MRRKDREVTDIDALEEIICHCDCLHLGLMDGDYPYIVPMNFGYALEDGHFVFYMHAASEGKKLELIRQNPHVFFCIDGGHELIKGTVGCTWSYRYESVMGRGIVTMVTDIAEKQKGMGLVFSHYSEGQTLSVPDQALEKVSIIRVDVQELTGKKRS